MTHIKDLRTAHGFTQQHMANILGITRGAYANIENEKREPDISTMILLADYFDVTVDYLIGHEKEPTVKDDGLTEMERLFLSLPRERRQEVLRFMEYQLSQASDE